MDTAAAMQTIRRLCSFEGRYPGTDAERRAANDLVEQVQGTGRKAEIEPTVVHPQWGQLYAAHLAIGFAGSVVALAIAPLGFALALVAATSLYLDMNTRFYLLRRLFFRHASQNVVSRGAKPDAPARLILNAHYDVNRTGIVFGPRMRKLAAGTPRRLGVVLGPLRIVFWSLALLVPILGARMAGIDAGWLSALQLPPTVVLIVGAVLILDIGLSEIVPGADDNASGVAVVLELAKRLEDEAPANLDVWVLLTGAEECHGEGMRNFVKAHKQELRAKPSYFVVLDTVGFGAVNYETSEGFAVSYPMDARLVQLCEAIAAADREGPNRFDAEPLAHTFLTDALPPRINGYPSIALVGAINGQPPPHYHTVRDTPNVIKEDVMSDFHDFALELVRQIDRDVGRRDAA